MTRGHRATEPQKGSETEDFYPLAKGLKGLKVILTGAIAKWIGVICLGVISWFSGSVVAQVRGKIDGRVIKTMDKEEVKEKIGTQINDSLTRVRKKRSELHEEMEERLSDNMVHLFMRQQKAMEATIPGYKEALEKIDKNAKSTERETEKIKEILERNNK
jgi:hypothetical protein